MGNMTAAARTAADNYAILCEQRDAAAVAAAAADTTGARARQMADRRAAAAARTAAALAARKTDRRSVGSQVFRAEDAAALERLYTALTGERI